MSIEKPTMWLQTSIGSLCNLINGRAFKPKEWSEAGLPIIRIQNLNNPDAKYNHFDGELADKQRIETGDLLFAWSGTPGTSFGAHVWKGETAALNQHIFKIEFSEALIDKRFLRYAINQTLDELISGAHGGVGLRHITKGKFEATEIAFPSLTEQKVIADKLDTLLAQVENTKARLERIPKILKRFRQSVLAAAVSGRLTEEWRRDSTYNGEGYPASWTFKHLSEVGQLARGKSKHRPRNDPRLFGADYPFIQTGEVANAAGEITSATRFYSEFGLQQSRLFPAGTLCITIAANIADTAILGIDACFPDSVVGFTPKDSEALAYFVKYLIDVNKQDLESFAPATAQKNINLKVLNELRLPFPSLEEQTEIVRRVDQLFAHADRIEHQVNNALTRVNNLAQSVLAKAFRGELTEQWRKDNPELISGENSAEALLERIKAERAAVTPMKKTRKRKVTA
ncbi:hypothetical protein GPM19_04445 [Halomonas sp. ZH2S]|uniref:Type I restriction modification DNA specificity domain-containing protein n=1 Tax=Vreelandella zhuhanensis TaxID=2684210 RepID=A0A7X3KQZ8_9GAMM|nr:restriction endonuclease subunit S [Halomonas zhuhanensis]MWJ27462.1 hypothetical protein [Halomonas zhuhanensis]